MSSAKHGAPDHRLAEPRGRSRLRKWRWERLRSGPFLCALCAFVALQAQNCARRSIDPYDSGSAERHGSGSHLSDNLNTQVRLVVPLQLELPENRPGLRTFLHGTVIITNSRTPAVRHRADWLRPILAEQISPPEGASGRSRHRARHGATGGGFVRLRATRGTPTD